MGALRLFLALTVVAGHLPHTRLPLMDNQISVICFFIISGFYMALIVNEQYSGLGEGWKSSFYLSRALRLFPVYWAVLIITLMTGVGSAIAPGTPIDIPIMIASFIPNFFIVGLDILEYPVNDLGWEWLPGGLLSKVRATIIPAWSLSPEILFYLLAPAVVLSPRRILALLTASLFVRLFFLRGDFADVWRYYFFPSTLIFFTMGSLSYYLYRRIKDNAAAGRIGTILLAAIVVFSFFLDRSPHERLTAYDMPSNWAYYVCFAFSVPFIFERTKDLKFDRLVGELSYPLYVVHFAAIDNLSLRSGPFAEGSLAFGLLCVGISLIAAILLYCLVGRPIDRIRHKIALLLCSTKERPRLFRSQPLQAVAWSIAIAFCIYAGPIVAAEYQIKSGKLAEIDRHLESGTIPTLALAVETGDAAVVKTLLAKGADVNETASPQTPLMRAADFPEIVNLLLDQGADVNAMTREGTALFAAIDRDRLDTAGILLDRGAAINARSPSGATPLTHAIGWGVNRIGFVKLLLRRGASVNETDGRKLTPLTAAVFAKHPWQTANLLIERGADVNARLDNGWTALVIARQLGKTKIVNLLHDAGAR